MSTKHGMVIRLIEEALGGPDGRAFAKVLLQMLELRFEEGLKRIRNDEEIEAIFETQRAIGAVDALVEVVGKLERISRRYAEVQCAPGDRGREASHTDHGARSPDPGGACSGDELKGQGTDDQDIQGTFDRCDLRAGRLRRRLVRLRARVGVGRRQDERRGRDRFGRRGSLGVRRALD